MSRSEPSAPEQEHARRARPRRLILPLIGIAGLFAAIMFAAAMQGLPQFGEWPGSGAERPPDDALLPAPTESSPPPIEPREDSPLLAIIGFVLGVLLLAAVLVAAYFGVRSLIRFLVGLWRDRPLARQEAASVDVDVMAGAAVDAEPDAATIRRGIAEALRTIDERPVPGDSIVAAWVGLEESAADAGAGRSPHETPAEFTVRIVGARGGIAADVRTLLALYEQVRFGGHDADEDDRATASACLRGIQAGWR